MKYKIYFFLFFLFFTQKTFSADSSVPSASGANGKNATPTYEMHGNALLVNNLVERGITQTNKEPALVGSFWFNFGPQVSLGLSGSNVNYARSTNTHLKLVGSAQIKVDLTQNTRLDLDIHQNQYYSDSTRNGSEVKLNLTAMETYLVSYSMISNFEGTSTSSTNYSFGYMKKVFGTWKWETIVGYNMLSTRTYNNFFDYQMNLSQKNKTFIYGVGITGTQDSSQFAGDGDMGFLYFIGAEF